LSWRANRTSHHEALYGDADILMILGGNAVRVLNAIRTPVRTGSGS
jgi:hypothetical protein